MMGLPTWPVVTLGVILGAALLIAVVVILAEEAITVRVRHQVMVTMHSCLVCSRPCARNVGFCPTCLAIFLPLSAVPGRIAPGPVPIPRGQRRRHAARS